MKKYNYFLVIGALQKAHKMKLVKLRPNLTYWEDLQKWILQIYVTWAVYLWPVVILNKNDNIHKAELKKSDDQTNIDKYRVAANITEYHIISKLIYRRIIIPKRAICLVRRRTDGGAFDPVEHFELLLSLT